MQSTMTFRLIVAVVSLAPWTAARATPPFYDPGAYCRQATRSGSAEQNHGACYRQEQAAYDRIKPYWDGLTVWSRAYCDGMAETIGNSYQILETCLNQQETAAKGAKKQLPGP
jgi:hypothetical protein